MSRRKEATAEATNEPEPIGGAVAEVLSNVQQHDDGTDFDPAKLEAQQPSREPGDDSDEPQPARGGIAKKQYKRAPDPRGMHIIDLSPDPKGPKARLLRSNDHEAMLIQFSEKPEPEILNQLREAGFRWENRANSDFARGSWVINLERGNEWRNHAHAEAVFQSVVNQIREKNGMDPFVPGAAQSV
jgi:hypothetical protein